MKGNSSVADYREKDRIDGKDAGSFSTARKVVLDSTYNPCIEGKCRRTRLPKEMSVRAGKAEKKKKDRVS